MEFFTYSDTPRPTRLSEATREFARESLEHKYGTEARQTPAVALDGIRGFADMSPIDKYNAAIAAICDGAPVRLVDGELISGSATLGMAIDHCVPATVGGKPLFESVSHLTADFETVLRRGIDGIESDIRARITRTAADSPKRPFLESALHCIDCIRRLRGRYLAAMSDKPAFAENARILAKVPFAPAESFREAVASIWFAFVAMRITGNWPGIGRIDVLLGNYLSADLSAGKITLDEAREILAHFFIKGCEWITGAAEESGDAQHYQNLVIGGIDAEGRDVTNEVTYLVLDIIEELPIGDFPTTLRVGKTTPPELLRRTAEVMKHGGGTLAVYGEDTAISALTAAGIPEAEARGFANDGCWEVQIPGRTNFAYIPIDALNIFLADTLRIHDTPAHFDTYEELRSAFFADLTERIAHVFRKVRKPVRDNEGRLTASGGEPCTVISLFEGGCIENGASYNDYGTDYVIRSPHLGGIADVGNSLRVIDKLCFRDRRIGFDEFMAILHDNWEGAEALRQHVINGITVYGNGDAEADAYVADVADTFADIVHSFNTAEGLMFVPGISTFGRQIEWIPYRPASPHGHRRGEILAANMSPTPGSDTAGVTALIRSYCRIDHTKQTTGAALDAKILAHTLRGEAGVSALAALIRGFADLGGFFIQPDVQDASVLREAQEHPERYGSLSVRVSGWNARFVTLGRRWQDMCIEQMAGDRS